MIKSDTSVAFKIILLMNSLVVEDCFYVVSCQLSENS